MPFIAKIIVAKSFYLGHNVQHIATFELQSGLLARNVRIVFGHIVKVGPYPDLGFALTAFWIGRQ